MQLGDRPVITNDKTLLTRPPAGTNARTASPQAAWAEARSVYPIYLALANHFDLGLPFANERRSLPEKSTPELLERIGRWLNEMDQQIQVYQLRQLLQTTTLNASEESLRSLTLRHLRKPEKNPIDRDKIDFLLVQYFALCAPAKIYHKNIELTDVALVLKPVLGEVDPSPLEWCQPLEQMIGTLQSFRSLRELLQTNFIEQGRRMKDAAGGMFYDPSALLAFVRFNFLLRRTFIELMHADLIAIRTGLNQLEQAGTKTINCLRFGLSVSEPIAKVKQIADSWKQPFHKEYTETTVNQAFAKLQALRDDVERALESQRGRAPASSAPPRMIHARQAEAQSPPEERKQPPLRAEVLSAEASAVRTKNAPPSLSAGPVDLDGCLEKIWEQLIATPPSRGRSMTTVTIGKARILMSSWEVAAFVSDGGTVSEDLRRAVAVRALVIATLESAKESGNATALERALAVARKEASRLQESVEAAKRAKDTEAAVNLGISTKRLVSALDEAEKL
jgi:hypothetical protein